MNAIDGTERTLTEKDGPPQSLLVVILDTNPHAWAHLHGTLPLQKAVANLLVFINAHLAINHANRVAVLASHSQKVEWLYPTPKDTKDARGNNHNGLPNGNLENGTTLDINDANKYPPFRTIERELLSNLSRLMESTTAADLGSTTTTMIAGALTTALCHINKTTILESPQDLSLLDGVAGAAQVDNNDGTLMSTRATITSRILVVSVSGDLASQYIPVMNSIFAAQRQRIPIDILKVAGDTVFLQQASDATGGVYMKLEEPRGLLQYLMMAFLPDATARRCIVQPSVGEVDFRAACFCHRKVIDIGYVCSVCLSIFCSPLADGTCLTCGSQLSLSAAVTAKPALIPRKKKKRKRAPGDATPASAVATPTPSGGTPGPS